MMRRCGHCKKRHLCSKRKAVRLRRVYKRSTKNEETAKIRYQCLARAGIGGDGLCECGCLGSLILSGSEMDHFYGRARGQSISKCWMLITDCHRKKTNNDPSRAHWDDLFAAHCAKYGYEFTPRILKRIVGDAAQAAKEAVSAIHEPIARKAAP